MEYDGNRTTVKSSNVITTRKRCFITLLLYALNRNASNDMFLHVLYHFVYFGFNFAGIYEA